MRNETIAAIATGLNDSGIGIIRISGMDAIAVGDACFFSPSGKRILKNAESHKMYYGFVRNEKEIIDEVMTVVMKAPRSFTGEDTVEIQCHGGVLVMKKILSCVLKNGARMAEPGEFTKRAFLNGRMDLSRAEAVIDVIHSQNDYALSASVGQLTGKLSEKIKKIRAAILYEIAFIESALDDPEHISLDGYSERLHDKIERFSSEIQLLLDTVEDGKIIKEGIQTVIVGRPNAGKSSLLNLLAGEEAAIVTDIAGTTRDVLKETVRIGNISLALVDTAGIRNTEDTVEKIGVERAKQYAKDADLILYVVDSSSELDENDEKIISLIQEKNVIVLLNKSDLDDQISSEEWKKKLYPIFEKNKKNALVRTSAKNGEGLEEFETILEEMFFSGHLKNNDEIVITNLRHKEALQESYDSLSLVKKSLEDNFPEDFYSIDLMSAYESLGRIIGENVDDDLVEEIFSKFCMGK